MGRPVCDDCKNAEECDEEGNYAPNLECGSFECKDCPDLKKEIITLKEDYEALKTAERIFIRKCGEKDEEIKKLKYYERIRQPDAKDARIKQLEKGEFDLECEILDKNEEIRQLKEQIERLKEGKDLYNEQAHIACRENQRYWDESVELKEQIEQMKNCGNCKFEPESGRVCEWKHYIEGKKRCNVRECWELKT